MKTPSVKAVSEFYLQPQLSRRSQVLLQGIFHPAETTAEDISPKDQCGPSWQRAYTYRRLKASGGTNLEVASPDTDNTVTFPMSQTLHIISATQHQRFTPQELWIVTGTCSVTPNMVVLLPPRDKRSYCCTSTSEPEVKPESLRRK